MCVTRRGGEERPPGGQGLKYPPAGGAGAVDVERGVELAHRADRGVVDVPGQPRRGVEDGVAPVVGACEEARREARTGVGRGRTRHATVTDSMVTGTVGAPPPGLGSSEPSLPLAATSSSTARPPSSTVPTTV